MSTPLRITALVAFAVGGLLLAGAAPAHVSAPGPTLAPAPIAHDEPDDPTAAASASEAATTDVETVAKRYQDFIVARKLDETRELLHEDLFFIDPTADVFPGELATGIRGRDTVLALQKTWGTTPWTWERSLEFTSGTHAVAYGTLKPDDVRVMPFVNILRVRDGVITERIDYGDYGGFTARLESGEADTHLQDVADAARKYIAAYGAVDLDALVALMAEDIDFQDPTGELFGPTASQPVRGREAVATSFRLALEGLQDFSIEVRESFFSRNHAVFITEVAWKHPEQQGSKDFVRTIRAPLVVALRVEDGKVVHHRDFWDAEEYVKHLR